MTRPAPTLARDARVARAWAAIASGLVAYKSLGKCLSGNAPVPT
ncbi:MAG: hypothetical protein ABIO71_07555 [Caldimonas sp.]